MKLVFVFLTTSVFFFLLSLFVVQNFSPFDISKLQEIVSSTEITSSSPEKLDVEIASLISKGLLFDYLSTNAYLAFGLLVCAASSFFAAIHLFVDKVFFKSIWQTPSLFNALRRSILLIITLVLVVYLKLLRVDTLSLLLVPISTLVIEFIYISVEKDLKNIKNKIFKKPETSESN